LVYWGLGERKLLKKTVSVMILAMVLISALTLASKIQPAKASGTIYIEADGTVSPSTAPISTVDYINYIFTDSISDSDGIVIQRSNIIVDGDGYTLQGTEAYPYEGISLSGCSNVTIKKLNIDNFYYAICLTSTVHNVVSGNNLTNNIYGICLDASSENTLSENSILGIQNYGIHLNNFANNNTVSDNNITESGYGLFLQNSSNNVLRRNHMSNDTRNFGISGGNLSAFLNDIDSTNTVDEKPIYYWVNKTGMAIPSDAGYIVLVNCEEITVADLNLTKNFEGILLAYSTNITVTNNKIADTYTPGITLIGSSNNNISRNNLTDCGLIGIELQDSSFNTICSNELTHTSYHLLIAFALRSSSFNNISENTIGGLAVGLGFYIRENSENNTILANSVDLEGDGFYLLDSNYNTISGNTVPKENKNNPQNKYSGVHLRNSSSNIISGNSIANKEYGIHLYESTNNSIVGNSISNSTIYGIWFESSENNKIYHNTISKCALQVNSTAGYANTWDDGYPSGGNYWSDYNGVDSNSDGIGDTPYVIDANNTDRYPLTKPYGGPDDIGIANFTTSKTIIGQGYSLNISIKIINYGLNTETFNLTIYANTIILLSITNIVLTSRNSEPFLLYIDWFVKGNYTIWAYATPVPGETDTTDNSLYSEVCVTIPGDVDGDFDVDLYDAVGLLVHYGAKKGQLQYDIICDIDGDGDIDLYDAVILLTHYGQKYP
jgi:parallel beta-helix repeat protein